MKNLPKRLRNAGLHAALFLAVMVFLWLSLTAAAAIPNDAIRANTEKSVMYYAETNPYQFHSKRWSAIEDNYADAILLGITWNMGEGNPFVSALNTCYNDGGDAGENTGLYNTVMEGAAPNTDYTRYWHGSAAVIRPLLCITDVQGIKWIGFAVMLVLIGVSMAMLVRQKHADLAVLLALSLLAVHIWNVRLSLEYQPPFLITFAMLPLWLISERRSDRALSMLSVAAGAAVAFFDFLTTETLTVLLPLILVTAIRAKEDRLAPRGVMIRQYAACGAGWILAYAGAFLWKWIAASAVSGESVFAHALSSVGERVGTQMSSSGVPEPLSFFSPLTGNLTMLFTAEKRVSYLPTWIFVTLVLGVFLAVWYMMRRGPAQRDAAILLLLLGAMVPLRYLVLNNHSYMHVFFTYRAMASAILAMLAALWLQIRPGNGKKGRKKRR
ncbi:MAG: hypothetical protein E7662_08970 [Ruminococcaceae bacterium]|nr:hypothetical protein [Oscillospiraceae bacterium]